MGVDRNNNVKKIVISVVELPGLSFHIRGFFIVSHRTKTKEELVLLPARRFNYCLQVDQFMKLAIEA